MERFTGRRILVSGSGSGMGRAIVLRLLREGGTVVGVDISADGLEGTAALAEKEGTADRLTTRVLDISDEAAVTDVVGSSITDLGGLDVLVNAAGMLRAAHTHEETLEQWNRVIGVNLTGTFLMVRTALPALVESGAGVIINFASTSATFAHPYMTAYAASKGGIQSMTHSLALEYAKQGLRAVTMVPGGVESNMTATTLGILPEDRDWDLFGKLQPVLGGGRFGSAESVAGVVAMAASEDGAFISGTEIRIDGGCHG
ncbi:SDR family NAD(P)-dependent oxidoreductase [Nocardiopsis dassonvillei]|uniref:SDR family NAD(P)-dependent oxidoreductase n=1 Tax=Nocardiopsis dassonvillei TaxID=2014 RepID=UPI00366C69E4